MTTTDNPLPAFLAVPDGDEPLSEGSLDWVAQRLAEADAPTLATALAEAADFYDREEAGDSDGTVEMIPREVVRWQVNSEGEAEWALRKLAAVEVEGEEVAAQAEAWIASVERWRDERMRPLNARAAFFTDRLTGWLRRLRDEDPKVKSKSLPSGTVSSRVVGPRVEVVNSEAVAAWARDAGHDEVLKVEIRLTELKKAVKMEGGAVRDADTGQPIPGTTLSPGGVSFSVRVGG